MFPGRPFAGGVVVSTNCKHPPTSRPQRLEYLLVANVSDVHHRVAVIRVLNDTGINETVCVRNKRDAYAP